MNIVRFILRNHQVSLVAILLLFLLGLVSLSSMPRSEDPQLNFPTSFIQVISPGIDPLDMEKLIVDPIEQALNELEDVKHIKSQIEDGMALIRIEFLYGSDPDDTYDDTVAAVARIRSELPQTIQRLKIDKLSPNDTHILQYALISENKDYRQARYLAEKLQRQLQPQLGIKRINIDGIPRQEVSIRANLTRMRNLNISLTQLVESIESNAINMPAGHVNAQQQRFTVKTSGDYSSIDQIRRTLVSSKNAQLIYVEDIATVEFADGQPSYLAEFNQTPAVFISVVQHAGSNIFEVVEGIEQKLVQFRADLPEGFSLLEVFNQSVGVEQRIDGFFNNLLQGLLIVGGLSLLLLGFRASAVVITAIPLSVLIGIGWLDLANFGLQQMSIVGLVIALGLLVDNAIVVTENVGRALRKGLDRHTAVEQGASQVSLAIASGTLTTILAFFPILLLPTDSGSFMRSMPVTVVLTLLASLIVAIAFTPLLAGRMLKPSTHVPYLQRKLENVASGHYKNWLKNALHHPKIWLTCAMCIFACCIALFPFIGVSLFPKAEHPGVLINIERPVGSSFDSTAEYARIMAELVGQQDSVESVTVNIGRGNPRIYYNVIPNRQVSHFAQLYVQFDHYEAQQIEQFIATMRKQFDEIAGARVAIKQFTQGPAVEAPIEIRLIGDNIQLLRNAAIDIEQLIVDTEGTINVQNPIAESKIDLRIDINREKAALVGITPLAIDQAVKASLSGYQAGTYRDQLSEEFAIIVRKEGLHEPTIDELQAIHISNQKGDIIPLSQVADFKFETGLPSFRHLDLQRMVAVTADVANGYLTEEVTNNINTALSKLSLPHGITFQIGGEQANRKESFSGMNQAFIFALVGIFAVLVMQFKSFSQPLIIFAAIPFAVSGAFLGLFITGYTFSFTAFIGLTSLIGIVVNNSIILVDFANQKMEQGLGKHAAIVQSAVTRLSPILLTSLTTMGGLLPLTLEGSGMWSPMGWAIIFGLSVSTLLTLFVVPILYVWFTKRH